MIMAGRVARFFSELFCKYDPFYAEAMRPAPVDRSQLGAQAKRLLDDPVLSLAFDSVERDLIATWRKTAVGHREQREEAYRLLWALEGVRARLTAFVGNAKVIDAEQKMRDAAATREAERRERYGQ